MNISEKITISIIPKFLNLDPNIEFIIFQENPLLSYQNIKYKTNDKIQDFYFENSYRFTEITNITEFFGNNQAAKIFEINVSQENTYKIIIQYTRINHTIYYLIFGTLPIILILALFISAWIHASTIILINPIEELGKKLAVMKTAKNVEVICPSNVPIEIYNLYNGIQKLPVALSVSRNSADVSTQDMLNYAESYELFKNSNQKAAGICLNNIANIHFRAKRYSEAVKSYFNSLNNAKEMLARYFGTIII